MPYYEGSLSSKIAFIGESPGATEIARNRPFVGSAGELLDTIMHSAGILRSDCYLDNVMQQRPSPTSNDISTHIRFNKFGECVFQSETIKREVQQLYARLRETKAEVLVPLGNVAMWLLTEKYFITKRRGSILKCIVPGLESRRVIPTFHPSGVLHGDYLNKWFIAFDIARVKDEIQNPRPLLDRTIHMHPTLYDAIQYISECHYLPQVGFDIEVSRKTGELTCFSLAKSPTNAMSIPLFYSKGDYFNPDDETRILVELARLLEDENIQKLGQNIIFDTSFMTRKYGIKTRNTGDTMIAMAILYPEFPKDLGAITSMYTREPYYKDDSKYASESEMSNDERFWRYNALDSLVVIEAYPKLLKDIERSGNASVYERQNKIVEPLRYISEKGFPIDTKRMQDAAIQAQADLDDKYQRLYALCGFQLNINSPKQLQSYFYVHRGYSPYYKDGALTVDNKALRRLAAKGAPEASLLIEMKRLDKLRSQYYEMKIDPDERIRCSWNPVGTKWSRVSSSQTIFDTGGNMQNLPKPMKALMHPDPGYVLCSFDLSQAENRVVGYLANEIRMIAAFEAGVDIHSLTYALIADKPVEDVSREECSCELGNGQQSERDWGKRANHALNYNVGPQTFALNYEISVHEATAFIAKIYLAYPGIKVWHQSIRDQLSKDRTLTNLMGRKCVFRDRWNDDLFRSAYSYIPQSTVGDIINEYGLNYIYFNQDKFHAVELLNQVHDSIVFQFPMSLGVEALATVCVDIKKSLEIPLHCKGRTFAIPAALEVGFNMRDMEKIKSENFEGLVNGLSRVYELRRTADNV